MKQYHDLLQHILDNGTRKGDRTGVGTLSIFGYQMRFDLSKGFPIVTTKKISFKNIVVELLWFLRGDTNVKFLNDNGCTIWNEDAYNYYCKLIKGKEDLYKISLEEFHNQIINTDLPEPINGYKWGDCGHQYGWLWRSWGEDRAYHDGYHDKIDQVKNLIHGLRTNPESRRQIITAWNPATLNNMALHACHALVQFNCRPLTREKRQEIFGEWSVYMSEEELDNANAPKYYLDCQLYQRSADVILGVPYNISSYCLLTHILCEICNMVPGEFIHTFGDVHIYNNHMDAVKEQLERDPELHTLPELYMEDECKSVLRSLDGPQGYTINDVFEELKWDMFGLKNYKSYPKLENETKLNTGLK